MTVLLVTLFVFIAFELIPGDAATARLGINATPEALMALREEMGLTRPFFIRYFSWLGSFFFGDFLNNVPYCSFQERDHSAACFGFYIWDKRRWGN